MSGCQENRLMKGTVLLQTERSTALCVHISDELAPEARQCTTIAFNRHLGATFDGRQLWF